MREELIQFRPHHFMCTIGFQGMGYCSPFIKNYEKIVLRLKENPNLIIQIVSKGDNICQACPHLRKNIGCKDYIKVDQIDQRHSEVLGFKVGDQITWSQAQQIIKEKMTAETLDYACRTCEWKASGVCLAALKKL